MVQFLIIAALVLWSTVVVFKKVFPKTANATFMWLSNSCSKQGWSSLAKWLKPAAVTGCGGNCGCSSDESNTPQPTEIQAVKWK